MNAPGYTISGAQPNTFTTPTYYLFRNADKYATSTVYDEIHRIASNRATVLPRELPFAAASKRIRKKTTHARTNTHTAK